MKNLKYFLIIIDQWINLIKFLFLNKFNKNKIMKKILKYSHYQFKHVNLLN